jgi:hypothetical protein
MAGQQTDQPIHPSEEDLPPPGETYPLNFHPEFDQARSQRTLVEVDQVPRHVEPEPILAENPGLDTASVWNGDDQEPSGLEQLHRVSQSVSWMGKMLQRVPKHDSSPVAGHFRYIQTLDEWPGSDALGP